METKSRCTHVLEKTILQIPTCTSLCAVTRPCACVVHYVDGVRTTAQKKGTARTSPSGRRPTGNQNTCTTTFPRRPSGNRRKSTLFDQRAPPPPHPRPVGSLWHPPSFLSLAPFSSPGTTTASFPVRYRLLTVQNPKSPLAEDQSVVFCGQEERGGRCSRHEWIRKNLSRGAVIFWGDFFPYRLLDCLSAKIFWAYESKRKTDCQTIMKQ